MKHAYNAQAFLDIPHCFLWIGPYGFVSSHALGLVLDRGFMVGQIDIICRSYCLFAWPNPKFSQPNPSLPHQNHLFTGKCTELFSLTALVTQIFLWAVVYTFKLVYDYICGREAFDLRVLDCNIYYQASFFIATPLVSAIT